MSIGDRIQQFADEVFGSADAMAKALSPPMHPVQLSNYVTGKSKPGTDVLQRFQAVGMSIDWMLSGDGSMHLERGDQPEAVREEKDMRELAKYMGKFDATTLLKIVADQLRRSEEDQEQTPSP